MKIKPLGTKKTKSRSTKHRTRPPFSLSSHAFSRVHSTRIPTYPVRTQLAILQAQSNRADGMWVAVDGGPRFLTMNEISRMRGDGPYDPNLSHSITEPIVPRPMPRNGGPFAESRCWGQHHLSVHELHEPRASQANASPYYANTPRYVRCLELPRQRSALATESSLLTPPGESTRSPQGLTQCSGTSDCQYRGCMARHEILRVQQMTEGFSRMDIRPAQSEARRQDGF